VTLQTMGYCQSAGGTRGEGADPVKVCEHGVVGLNPGGCLLESSTHQRAHPGCIAPA